MNNYMVAFYLVGVVTLFSGCDSFGLSQTKENSISILQRITHDKGTLVPAFDPSVTRYTLVLDNTDSSVTLSGLPEDVRATVSAPVELRAILAGQEIPAPIVVTAESGAKQVYTVIVVRNSPFGGSTYQSAPTLMDPFSDTYVTTKVTFRGGDLILASSLYKGDATCTVSTSHIWDWTTTADVIVTEQPDGSYHMQMAVSSVTITVVDAGAVDWENQIGLCGITDWVLDTPRQVAGLELISGMAIPKLNQVLLDTILGNKDAFRTCNAYPPIVSSVFNSYPAVADVSYQFTKE